jgi:hypothetical protein
MHDLNITVARKARLRRHLRRLEPVLARLRAQGRDEPNVLAILAVEAFYRPRLLRGLEYVAWAALSILMVDRVRRISVGIAQMKLENWVAVGLLDSTRFSAARLRRVRKAESCYEACRRYLGSHGVLQERDPRALSIAYAGGERRHFALMLKVARDEITQPARREPAPAPAPLSGA